MKVSSKNQKYWWTWHMVGEIEMNTDDIMAMAVTGRDATSEYSYSKEALQSAIESLMHERDALSAGWEQERNVSDKWNLECDELREDNKRLAAENKALRDGIRVYQTQIEKDTSESDLDTLVRQGAEVAELKVENKALRDALAALKEK